MAIQIESDKISQGLKAALQMGRRPDLCLRLANGCRVGLPYAFFRYPSPPGNLSQGDWPKLLSSPNVQMASIMGQGYFCEAEPDCSDPNKKVNYRVHVVARNLDEALSYAGPCDTCQQTGGFPRPKNVVEQLVDGLYKLATTNPAILACLMVAGPTCPIISVLSQLGISWNSVALAWQTASVAEISSQISQACRALNIKPEYCPTYIAQAIWNEINKRMGPGPGPGPGPVTPPPVSQDSIAIYVNGVLVAVVPAKIALDGAYSVSASLPIVGSVSFIVNFANCSLDITNASGSLQVGIYRGSPIGAGICRYQVGSYTVELRLVRAGQAPPPDSKTQPDQTQLLIIGGLVLIGLAAIILVSR